MNLYLKLIEIKDSIGLYLKPLTVREVGLYGAVGFIGGSIAKAYGGWSPVMTLLIILMASDYLTGVLASLKEKKGIKSSVSFWGLLKKGLMMLSVLIANHIDIVMNTQIVMNASIYFWYANEVISLTENYARLGLPLPDVIKDKIAILKNKESANK